MLCAKWAQQESSQLLSATEDLGSQVTEDPPYWLPWHNQAQSRLIRPGTCTLGTPVVSVSVELTLPDP